MTSFWKIWRAKFLTEIFPVINGLSKDKDIAHFAAMFESECKLNSV